jgi:hypothetical protein
MEVVVVIFIVMGLYFVFTPDQRKHDPIPEQYPIIYPLEPMFENYISIAEDIRDAQTQKQIYACYVRYVLFASCYNDAGSFVHELHQAYCEKEAQLI